MLSNAVTRGARPWVLAAVLACGLMLGVSTAAAFGTFTLVPGIESFQVLGTGTQTVHMGFVSREALCGSKLYVFKVDAADGSINGVLPGDPAWRAQVDSRNPQLVFNGGVGSTADLSFQGGELLGFRFVASDCNTFYSYTEANPDGKIHMHVYQNSDGQPWRLAWEDASDFDFNDMVVDVYNVQGMGAPPAAPPTINSFTSTDQTVMSGHAVTLSWISTNSDSCSVSSDPANGGSASGQPDIGDLPTPILDDPGVYTWTLTCTNAAGSTTANVSVGVFNSDEQVNGSINDGQNTDPVFTRSIEAPPGCRWKSETNTTQLKTITGLVAGGLKIKVDWCVRGGKILKVVRSTSVIGPNYPVSFWKFDEITSYGPCNEQCDNYATLYGTGRPQINIWEQGHWSECIGVPVLGSICVKEEYRTVGVLIRGDGTRVDTYDS